ncbi:MAG: monooxygenase [Deltaproteobacteria bacterium]|nr:MAG: monooxygenase [Deltaproteobacteria bacterium]
MTYHKDVRPLLEAKCTSCHADGDIAPFALDTYAQAVALKDSIRRVVVDRTMPPYLPAPGCNEYVAPKWLSEEEIATIERWVDEGAKEGDPADYTPPPALSQGLTLDRVDLTLAMPDAYTPRRSPDDYHCFVLDWPETETKYVTGFRVKPGNPKVVHHVIAFGFRPKGKQAIYDLDAAEPGPGYTCFGDAGGDYEEMFTLGAWAPGGTDKVLPEGVGIEVPPGSVIVLQVHYNTLNGVEPDLSSIEMQLSGPDEIERPAAILWWTNFRWPGGEGMKIPAGEPDVMHSFSFDPTPYMDLITGGVLQSGQPFAILSVSHHMHQLGTRGYQAIRHGGQETDETCLLDIPRWDFNWQDSYTLAREARFEPGDELYLECHWDNSPANQPLVDGEKPEPRDVAWGDGTQDEMCLGVFLVSTPKTP